MSVAAVTPSTPVPGPDPGVETVLLDRDGTITATDDAWDRYAAANGADPVTCGVGASYVRVCDRAGDAVSARVADAIRRAGAGRLLAPAVFALLCPSPTTRHRHYLVTVTARLDEGGTPLGSVVALEPVPLGAVPLLDLPTNLSAAGWTGDLVQHLPDGVLLVDGEGRIRYANDAAAAMSGHDRADLLLASLDLLVPARTRERHHGHVAGFTRRPRVRMMGDARPLVLQRRDGTPLAVEIALAPTQVAGVPLTVATIRDVSRQREQEHQTRRLLEVLDLDPGPVWVVDAESGVVDYVSKGAEDLLGYRREQLLGLPFQAVSPAATEDVLRAGSEPDDGDDPVVGEGSDGTDGSDRRGLWGQATVTRLAADGAVVPVDSRTRVVRLDGSLTKVILVDRDARGRLAAEDERRRRTLLSETVARVHGLVLGSAPESVVQDHVVLAAAALVGAENAGLVVTTPSGVPETVAVVGPAGRQYVAGQARLTAEQLARWADGAGPVRLTTPPEGLSRRVRDLVSEGLVVPFPGPSDAGGLLTVFRARGREPFSDLDVELLTSLSQQVATALGLGRERAERARLSLVQERQRIARDLHDHVIQDVIGIGLQLLATPAEPLPGADRLRRRDESLATQLEDVVTQLRLVVFATEHEDLSATDTSQALDALLDGAQRVLGFRPRLRVRGDLAHVPTGVRHHLVPVLREGLANIARHARAQRAEIHLTATRDALLLRVDDDGVGPQATVPRGEGLSNIEARALALGGTTSWGARRGGGSRLRWRVPLVGTPASPSPHGTLGPFQGTRAPASSEATTTDGPPGGRA